LVAGCDRRSLPDQRRGSTKEVIRVDRVESEDAMNETAPGEA
jgi:hypothetical protein